MFSPRFPPLTTSQCTPLIHPLTNDHSTSLIHLRKLGNTRSNRTTLGFLCGNNLIDKLLLFIISIILPSPVVFVFHVEIAQPHTREIKTLLRPKIESKIFKQTESLMMRSPPESLLLTGQIICISWDWGRCQLHAICFRFSVNNHPPQT